MAVPAHDERDYEFAIKFQIPVIQVIEPAKHEGNGDGHPKLPYTGDGVLVSSAWRRQSLATPPAFLMARAR
jgi:leucyl-tRNA synthetase